MITSDEAGVSPAPAPGSRVVEALASLQHWPKPRRNGDASSINPQQHRPFR